MKSNIKEKRRTRRKLRLRKRLMGTTECPRLSVYRSGRHIYAQLIDDLAGTTVASSSTRSKTLRGDIPDGGTCAAAAQVGTAIGAMARSHGVERVVFDRSGYRYHGRVKALADAAREAGLKF